MLQNRITEMRACSSTSENVLRNFTTVGRFKSINSCLEGKPNAGKPSICFPIQCLELAFYPFNAGDWRLSDAYACCT